MDVKKRDFLFGGAATGAVLATEAVAQSRPRWAWSGR